MLFGSLPNAYASIHRNFDYIDARRQLKNTAIGLATELADLQAAAGRWFEQRAGRRSLMTNKRALIAVVVLRCTGAGDGALFWPIRAPESRVVETRAVVRVDESNVAPLAFHLLPRKWLTLLPVQLSGIAGRCIAPYRCRSLAEVSRHL